MKICAKALRHVIRRVTDRFVPRALILLYHRVSDLRSDPQLLCVSRQHFGEHLEVLRKHGYPMRLKALDQMLQRKNLGRCGIVVTFDDGYADNLHHAKPLLERYDIPATVFVATGYIDSKSGFWKDNLEQVFLQPGTLPETLHLNVKGNLYQWELGEAAYYNMEDFKRCSGWNVTRTYDPTVRQRLYRCLCQLLSPLCEVERQTVLKELLAWAGIEFQDGSVHRTLSTDEVIHLAKGGLVEVGSHTVMHPVLSLLPAAAQRDEIRGSKIHLEEILGHPVTSFAYPYGGRSHYSAETVAAVREAEFEVACSNFSGMVRRDADMWQLPRFLVRNWSGEEFSSHLREWLSY
jgi:peptidoglycan/xylan/chitin deacetylase (PgdA/CDA1 family)